LRPQRDVDIFLSFDFSARDKDEESPFKVNKLNIVKQGRQSNTCRVCAHFYQWHANKIVSLSYIYKRIFKHLDFHQTTNALFGGVAVLYNAMIWQPE